MRLFFIIFLFLVQPCFAQESSQNSSSSSSNDNKVREVIVPQELSWTERYILDEMRNLRIDLERLKLEIYNEMNQKQISVVDKAISYSGNTVNYFFVILTIAIASFGLFGWRSIMEVKTSIKNMFEKEVANILDDFQERLAKIEAVQLERNQEIIDKQEELEKQQEIGETWSLYNREEDYRKQLEYLEKMENMGEDEQVIKIEKSNTYLLLGFYDQTIEICDELLSVMPENTTLLYNRAAAYASLDRKEEADKDIKKLISLSPHFAESVLNDKYFSNLDIDYIQKTDEN